ncbi:hypothetical protein BC827DRAFT_1159520 [Russula dissimulans]|nr:hypothetical protein BC827DRAFT_1159520 [Russula dissimulans]
MGISPCARKARSVEGALSTDTGRHYQRVRVWITVEAPHAACGGCGGLSRDDGRVEETVEEKRSPDADVRVCRAAERNTDRLTQRVLAAARLKGVDGGRVLFQAARNGVYCPSELLGRAGGRSFSVWSTPGGNAACTTIRIVDVLDELMENGMIKAKSSDADECSEATPLRGPPYQFQSGLPSIASMIP